MEIREWRQRARDRGMRYREAIRWLASVRDDVAKRRGHVAARQWWAELQKQVREASETAASAKPR